MENKEIIAILQDMKKDFESEKILPICREGFCYWISNSNYYFKYHLIVPELKKDLIENKNGDGYWYKPYFHSGFKPESIQSRIDHLTRTIKRLQDEK